MKRKSPLSERKLARALRQRNPWWATPAALLATYQRTACIRAITVFGVENAKLIPLAQLTGTPSAAVQLPGVPATP